MWARPIREGVGNYGPWIKARVTPVLVIKMSRKSLGGWRARYSRGWQKDVSAQGDGEPHVWVLENWEMVRVVGHTEWDKTVSRANSGDHVGDSHTD